VNLKVINSKVNALLAEFGDGSLPIRIEEIAKRRGLKVMPYALEEDVSGVLVIEDGKGTIGYNHAESSVRRRFTIAHELGHFELHQDQGSLFLDKKFKVLFRSQSTPEAYAAQVLEQEANAFAAALLMPEASLKLELEDKEFDLSSEETLKELAKIFHVSSTAMYYRMANLGLI
jgi:Zn-dependent peptidase ImmA (M78 family)